MSLLNNITNIEDIKNEIEYLKHEEGKQDHKTELGPRENDGSAIGAGPSAGVQHSGVKSRGGVERAAWHCSGWRPAAGWSSGMKSRTGIQGVACLRRYTQGWSAVE